MGDEDHDRVMRLILARCPELTDADLALIAQPAPPSELLPDQIGREIMAMLEALEAKLDRLAEAVGVNGIDDDANQRSYERRGAGA